MEQTSQRELRQVDPAWTLGELMAHITSALTSSGPALSQGPSKYLSVEPEIALVIHTSGSTGGPKEVALTSRALIASAQSSNKFLGAKRGNTWSLLLPLTHIAGINVLIRSIELESNPIDLRNHQGKFPDADFTAIVPTHLYRALNGDENLLHHLQNAEAVLVGGAKLSDELRVRAIAAGMNIVESYGMTETSGGCIYNGQPLEGVEIEISSEGLIKISGNTLASTYLGSQEQWSKSFDGKWFTTSDIGLIENGKLRVISRVDDVVISGGENVSLDAIQKLITDNFPLISAAAFALPDSEWGNIIHLALAGGEIPSEDEIRNLLEENLGSFAKPKKIHRLDRIPLTSLGKVNREQLIEMVAK